MKCGCIFRRVTYSCPSCAITTPSTKPEVHHISQRHQRKTEFCYDRTCGLWDILYVRTDKQTYMLITILCSFTGARRAIADLCRIFALLHNRLMPNSHRRGRLDTDRTVLSGLAWRCELGITVSLRRTVTDCDIYSIACRVSQGTQEHK